MHQAGGIRKDFVLSFLSGCIFAQHYEPVLSDGLDQLPPKNILFTVILALVIAVEVCKKASNVGNSITD